MWNSLTFECIRIDKISNEYLFIIQLQNQRLVLFEEERIQIVSIDTFECLKKLFLLFPSHYLLDYSTSRWEASVQVIIREFPSGMFDFKTYHI